MASEAKGDERGVPRYTGLVRRIRLLCATGVALLGGAASVGIVAVAGPGTTEAGSGGATLKPDLKPIRPKDFTLVTRKNGNRNIRFDSILLNKGDGPLQTVREPAEPGQDCYRGDSRDSFASQRLFEDDGSGEFERANDTGSHQADAGCFYWHAAPGHDHWHFENFAKYTLIRERSGRVIRPNTKKIGFCLVDSYEFRDSSQDRYYDRNCDEKKPEYEPGISPGWADFYGRTLAGQQVKIFGRSNGFYCLVLGVDPINKLQESDETNNVVRKRIKVKRKRVVPKGPNCRTEVPRYLR